MIFSNMMSTTSQAPNPDRSDVQVLTDDESATVTFVADLDSDDALAPTEWITVAASDLVDLELHR